MSADNRSSVGPAQPQNAIPELLAHRETLLDALCTAHPFVEDTEDDPCFKPGRIKQTVRDIRHVIESVELAMKTPGNSQATGCSSRIDQAPPERAGKKQA